MGLAIGDALGASIEFEPPGTFVEVTERAKPIALNAEIHFLHLARCVGGLLRR